MTAALLPERLRAEFGLSFGRARERAVFAASIQLLRGQRWLPPRLRYLPPYIDARRRLAGESRARLARQTPQPSLVGRTKLV